MTHFRPHKNTLSAGFLLLLALSACTVLQAAPLRIMPVGDSITAGYTNNSAWTVPFEFGYRRQLYNLLTGAGYDFLFVGSSAEPFNYTVTGYGDPTHGGTVSPTFDLRNIDGYNYNGHHGYGGRNITTTTSNIAAQMTADNPDVILLMIGINGISTSSPGQLDTLVTTIFTSKPTVKLIVAEITPYAQSASVAAARNPLIVDYNTYIRDVLVPKFVGQGRSITRINQHRNFLTDPNNPSSATIDALYSNAINHPTNGAYDTMAQTWFEGFQAIIPAPATPLLSGTVFPAAIAQGTTIGTLSNTTPPAPETFTYDFAAGPGDSDNAKFTITGNQLKAGSYNFSTAPYNATYRIRVKATGGSSGRIGNKTFVLTTTSVDSDNDQLPDSWEMAKAGNLTSLTLTGDLDQDGLTDTAEYNLSLGAYPNINPVKADTDGDGLTDGLETAGAGQRPPTNPTLADTDGDSVSDLSEDNTGTYVSLLKTGTNPTIADTDSDGRTDGSELIDGSNPLSSSSPAAPTVPTTATTSSTTSSFYVGSTSNSDLLQGLTGVHTGWLTTNSASPTYLNDGVHGDDALPPVKGGWSAGTGTVRSIYTLPTGNGNGWDITGVTTIAAWTGGGFGNQKYTVSIRRVGEAAYTDLTTVDYHPFLVDAGGGSRVQITHPSGKLATRVTAIQFTMLAIPTTYSNGGRAVYREFDVFGSASAIPPTEILALSPPATGTPQSSLIWRSYPGKTYRVETSENLNSWSVLSNSFPSGGVTTRYQQDFSPQAPARTFYRVSANP